MAEIKKLLDDAIETEINNLNSASDKDEKSEVIKVIKPAGSELMDYLNKGYAICNKCGAVMDRKEDPEGGCGIYACPSCGWEIEELDYEYESADEMELGLDERGDEYLIFRDDMPPAGCKACGGPYPYCKASCKMFDD